MRIGAALRAASVLEIIIKAFYDLFNPILRPLDCFMFVQIFLHNLHNVKWISLCIVSNRYGVIDWFLCS